jgi:hypothetical protein
MPQVGLLLFFDQPYNSLKGSYQKFLISMDRVANLGQTYSINWKLDHLCCLCQQHYLLEQRHDADQ